MKICVIGGSGFIGTHLISEIRDNNQVTIIDKESSKEFPDLVEIGDIRDADFLNEKLKGYDIVVHLAAEHRDDVSPTSLYYDVNVKGTENVLNAMDKNAIDNIIFTSSVAIYGLNKENPDETHPADPFNHYGKSKWEAEKLLKKWASSTENKSVSVLRPTVVFGEDNRGNVYNLLNQIVSGKFLMIGSGKNKKSMAYVGNIVKFIDYLIHNMNDYQVYNYVDKPDLSTKELISVIKSNIDTSIPPVRIPYSLGMLGGYVFDGLAWISGKKLPISSVRVQKFCATTQFDSTKMHSTDFKVPFTIEEALERTLKYEYPKLFKG